MKNRIWQILSIIALIGASFFASPPAGASVTDAKLWFLYQSPGTGIPLNIMGMFNNVSSVEVREVLPDGTAQGFLWLKSEPGQHVGNYQIQLADYIHGKDTAVVEVAAVGYANDYFPLGRVLIHFTVFGDVNQIDSAPPDAQGRVYVYARGWAIDPLSPPDGDVHYVQICRIYNYCMPGGDQVLAHQQSEDVNVAYPGFGHYHRFEVSGYFTTPPAGKFCVVMGSQVLSRVITLCKDNPPV